MYLEEQKRIQEYFEKMYQQGEKPWREHGLESAFDDFLNRLKERYPNAKILDIGCGDGWISIKAAKKGHAVWGIDSSRTAIREAQVAAKIYGVENTTHFQMGDALSLPYKNNFFDAMIDHGLFHHILPENWKLYFENVTKVLRLKSLVYLSVFSSENPIGVGELFTPKSIKDLFGKYFSIISFAPDAYPTNTHLHLLHFVLERV